MSRQPPPKEEEEMEDVTLTTGSLAPQIGDHNQTPLDEHEEMRLEAVKTLQTQSDAYRLGVTIVPVPDMQPISSFSYTPFPRAGVSSGQMEVYRITPEQLKAGEITIPADAAIRAVSCFRCTRRRGAHHEREPLCKRCLKGESFHEGEQGLCADRRPASYGKIATAPLCSDGMQGEFHYTVSPSSKVQLKGEDEPPPMKPAPSPLATTT